MSVSKPQPTLEDLRAAPDAAWLWDVARARLVWANAPAIKAFDASSVFDLIDRPFDASEPALASMAALLKRLERGAVEEIDLAFPSLGKEAVFACRCTRHALADGREGLLAVCPAPKAPSLLAEAGLFEDLPVATFALAADGRLVFSNEAARGLFDHRTIASLQDLLQPTEQSPKLLERLAETRLVSIVCAYQSRYGVREARLTLRRPQQGGNVFALVVMEDVTERRQLERQMAKPSAAPDKLGPAEQQAFEDLGRTLTQATATPAQRPAAPIAAKSPVAPTKALPPRPQLPKALQDAFEKSPTPLAIVQNAEVVCANSKLAGLLGHATVNALLADTEFQQAMAAAPARNTRLGVPNAGGKLMELRLTHHRVPWQNGKAEQYSFEAVALPQAVKPASLPAVAVEPAPQPKPQPAVAAPAPEPATKAIEPVAQAKPAASEEELRSILDISADGIVTLDAAGAIRNFSAGAEAIFGYRNAEVLNKPFISLLNAESAATFKDYLAGLEGAGLASVFNDGREVTCIVKQGGNVPLFLNMGRLHNTASGAAYCAVLRDITSWKNTERELREAKDAAEEASRHKSEFLARVSHELRTPLNAIMGFSEIMRMGQYGDIRNEKYRGYLNDIHASGSHLLAMINDLLDLSRIEAGRMELNFTSVSLADCFDHAAKLLQEQATRARVLMRKSFPDNLPRIVADQRSMRQVMSNLLSNAIKYTDPGGQVIVSASLGTDGALSLRLKDTGIGMDAQELSQALQPFMRVDVPGRERQGTGLGLPLTKALVEANRAQFAISSEPGQGTLVEITFPTTRVLAE
ncbi:MAG: PAS domain S-box protein [Alphaproteobacteria bacterium]|nr:PAS domain S-box protein [Alphaproteobacteria bacterium]